MVTSARSPRTAVVLTLATLAVLAATLPAAEAQSDPQPVLGTPHVDAFAPALSSTGRYLAYRALRRDQVSPRQQVRRADLKGGGNALLNPSINGGVAKGNYSLPPVISGDGARVAFTTTAALLVPGDTNGRSDAFVRDASTHTSLLVSRAYDGDVANGLTGMVSLSRNGRYAVFTSSATDVVPGSTTPNPDVYRRDLATKRTVQVTVRRDGTPSRGPGSSSVDVSADGNLVVFSSFDTDLAPADGADGESDLFIRDMSAGFTRWLSQGTPTGADPSGVVISPSGAWVSSRWDDGSLHLTRVGSRVTSLVAPDAHAETGAFSSRLGRFAFVAAGIPYVRELSTGVDTALHVPAGGFVTNVSISGNGRVAAYDWTPDDDDASRIFTVDLG